MYAVRYNNEWVVGVIDGEVWTSKLLRLAAFFSKKDEASILGGEVVKF